MYDEFTIDEHREQAPPPESGPWSDGQWVLFGLSCLLLLGGVGVGVFFYMQVPKYDSMLGGVLNLLGIVLFAWPMFILGIGGVIGVGRRRFGLGIAVTLLAAAPWVLLFLSRALGR